MKDKFEILISTKYRPVLKKVSKELGFSMRVFLEFILILYVKELNEKYYDEIKDELGLK